MIGNTLGPERIASRYLLAELRFVTGWMTILRVAREQPHSTNTNPPSLSEFRRRTFGMVSSAGRGFCT